MADEKPKGKRGRKGIFTPEAKLKLIQAIQLGGTMQDAAGFAGINYTYLFDWLAKKTPEANELSEALKTAKGAGKIGWLAKIEKAASDGNWQAAAWKLERTDPDNYGRQRLELTGKDGGAVQVAAQVVLLPAPVHDADAWAKSVAADQAKLAQKLD